MNTVQHYYLDFTGCKYLGEMHKIIRETFNFPKWYGENWDAFWDLYGYYTHEEMLTHIRGLNTLPKEFDKSVAKMLEVFKDAEDVMPNMKWTVES